MNILSLFDGISCGQVALERAGIEINNYYASEVDKYAIQVTQKNYPDTIQLGDVTKWQEWEIDWASIDLLIGGSPCQGFSFAGKQLNFNDARSKLFFVYVDILNYIRKHNPNIKFLLENVKMKKEYQDVISSYLDVKPVEINSALVSAQNRKRLYWTNIGKIEPPENKCILLTDILEIQREPITLCAFVLNKIDALKNKYGYLPTMFNPYNLVEIKDKSPCLTAQGASQTKSSTVIINHNGVFSKLTPVECERLQTLEDNYTKVIPTSQRYKCLGNGWTVDVIAHIFKELKDKQ